MKQIVFGTDNQQADVVLTGQYASRYHAELLLLDNGDMYLIDKKSTNGTYVNGNRIESEKEISIQRGTPVSFADSPLDWGRVPEVVVPQGVKRIINIGSHMMNEIKIAGGNVSKFHATIRQMQDGKWYIADHSQSGTTVDGQRLPKDKYVELKAGQQILCGGIPVQNPVVKKGKGGLIGLIVGLSAAAVAMIVAAVILFMPKGDPYPFEKDKKVYTDTELAEVLKPTTTLLYFAYHYEAYITTNTIDLEDLIPTKFVKDYKSGDYVVYNADDPETSLNFGLATGFFISEDGYIATNRHVAQPWLYDKNDKSNNDMLLQIEEEIKDYLSRAYGSYVNAYLQSIKVKGVMDYCKAAPNGYMLDSQINSNVHEIIVSSDPSIDLAILQLNTLKTPEKCAYVPYTRILDEQPASGTKIVSAGFPLVATGPQELERTSVSAHFVAGNVNGTMDRYSFFNDLVASGGASGSPIFNTHGDLVGVVSEAHSTKNYNSAIDAAYLLDLIKEAKIIIPKDKR